MARISWQHRSLFCSLYVWTDDDHHWIMEDSAWSIPRSWQFHHHWTRCPAAHLSTRHRRGGGYVTAEICVRALGSLKVKEILWDALYIFVYTISAPNGQRQDLSNTTRFQCLRPKSSQDSKVMLYKQNYRNLWDGCGNALQVSLHALFAVTKMPTTLCNNPIKCHGSYALQLDLCTAWCGSLGNPRNSWPLSQKGSNRQSRQSLEADQTWGTPWNPPQKRSFLPENHQIFKPWSGTRGIQLNFQGWPFLRMFTWSEMAISSFPTLKIAILGELSQHFQTPTEHFTAMDLRDLSQTPSRASRTKAAPWDHSHGPKAW